jgi:hypothetical protein
MLVFSNQNFDFDFGMLGQKKKIEPKKISKRHVKINLSRVDVKSFRYFIERYIVVGCKLFLLWHQVFWLLWI